MSTTKQYFGVGSIWTKGLSNGAEARITISTIDEDREGDSLLPEGADLTHYNKNPVVLWAHQHDQLPVGRAVNVEIAKGRGITADWIWSPDEFAQRVRKAFEGAFVNAASIGFLPRAWDPLPGGRGVRFTNYDVLEFSLVPVPANPHAVRTLKSLGLYHGDAEDGDADEKTITVVGAVPNTIPLLADGRMLIDEEVINRAVHEAASQVIEDLTGRIADPYEPARALSGDQPVIQIAEDALNQLITDTLKTELEAGINALRGRVD